MCVFESATRDWWEAMQENESEPGGPQVGAMFQVSLDTLPQKMLSQAELAPHASSCVALLGFVTAQTVLHFHNCLWCCRCMFSILAAIILRTRFPDLRGPQVCRHRQHGGHAIRRWGVQDRRLVGNHECALGARSRCDAALVGLLLSPASNPLQQVNVCLADLTCTRHETHRHH